MDSAERAAVIGQLVALDNVLHGLLESLREADEAPPAVCEHPLEKRKYEGEMGSSTGFKCEQCGARVATALDTSRLVRPNQE